VDATDRIEICLRDIIEGQDLQVCPPRLKQAVVSAVFPGGARIRPRICLAVAEACAEERSEAADLAAASIELLHCGSLVHDDLPCFDDSPLRRGRASVHQAFGERLAVLAGDALIVLAFQALMRSAATAPDRLPDLIGIISRSVGMHQGIIAGQAWECEQTVDRANYQQLKTGSLFAAATAAGAAIAGADTQAWWALGERIGSAYQVVDDILDVAGKTEAIGKPIGQDEARGHPSAVKDLGLQGARQHFKELMSGITDAIPPCPGRDHLRDRILEESNQLLPRAMAEHAA
jgi:geranylgeranyl diphosphate synthase type II